MTIEKHNGIITIYEIIGDRVVWQQYIGYSKKEAIRKFKKKFLTN